MTSSTSAQDLAGWFAGRLPDNWFVEPPEVTTDRDEILVIGRLAEPDYPPEADESARATAREARIQRFREDTREQRMRIADEAEQRTGRKVAWGAHCDDERIVFTSLAVPVMTRLRLSERRVLDTLVGAGVARSRADALAWCVRLVRDHEGEWIEQLRNALVAVNEARAAVRNPRPDPTPADELGAGTVANGLRLSILRPVSGGVEVTFYGVRGSTPCAGAQFARYGGHSACVVLEAPDQPPIIFDLGTGLRPYGLVCQARGVFHGTALLSHLHWDHVQGIPFFVPLHIPGNTLDVHGPRQTEGPLGDVFAQMMRPPFFPIRPSDLGGEMRFHDTADDDFPVGLAKVRSRWVRHVGPTLGYRVEWNGTSVAYLPDHGPGTVVSHADDYIPPEVLDLCDGVDLLIHDAQHTREEYDAKRHWGHCTVDYAMLVAKEAGVRSLALFHHDPLHGDDDMDRIGREAGERAESMGLADLTVAQDGMTIELAAHPSGRPDPGGR